MPVSESGSQVINYFRPNQLTSRALDFSDKEDLSPEGFRLRVLHYEERLEWDRSHENEYLHGIAILLAMKSSSTKRSCAWHDQVPLELPPKSIHQKFAADS